MYKAVATMRGHDGHEWDTVIYSFYESYHDALDGVERFYKTYECSWVDVLNVTISKV